MDPLLKGFINALFAEFLEASLNIDGYLPG